MNVYKKLCSVIIVEVDVNACLKPSTKYVNGNALNSPDTGPFIMFRFQIIGVNHIHNCITIFNNCEKSGTSVVSAEVNLVNAIIKQNAQKTIYNIFNKLGKYPNAVAAIVAI